MRSFAVFTAQDDDFLDAMTADFFAMVRRDELWIRGAPNETRLSQGQAVQRGREIVASDTIEDHTLQALLHDRCDAEMDRIYRATAAMHDARVRGVATALSMWDGLQPVDGLKPVPHQQVESTITISLEGISIVTTPDAAAADYELLKSLLGSPTAPPPSHPLPIVWRNGSAAVLLHEAIGHAAEHGHPPIGWPRWLRARDRTRDGRSADLIAGEQPLDFRRESFRNIPLRRMTDLLIAHQGAPFELPRERIEVHLAAGGAYEPLTEMVTVHVAIADVVASDAVQRLPRFALRASRAAIAGALLGAAGDPLHYPGVICSREGQELFVASRAPVIVTAELA